MLLSFDGMSFDPISEPISEPILGIQMFDAAGTLIIQGLLSAELSIHGVTLDPSEEDDIQGDGSSVDDIHGVGSSVDPIHGVGFFDGVIHGLPPMEPDDAPLLQGAGAGEGEGEGEGDGDEEGLDGHGICAGDGDGDGEGLDGLGICAGDGEGDGEGLDDHGICAGDGFGVGDPPFIPCILIGLWIVSFWKPVEEDGFDDDGFMLIELLLDLRGLFHAVE